MIISSILSVKPDSISASWEKREFIVGETTDVKITVSPSNASLKNLSISNTSMADIEYHDGIARVTFKHEGTDTLRFYNEDTYSNAVKITVASKNDTSSGTTNNDSDNPESNTPPQNASPELTTGQKNALSKANDYLRFMPFSYSGLIEQLEYEGYSTEEATYAVDNCGANWNEQAAKKAQEYLNIMSFSRQGLIDQLKYEGFTQEQAEYGVSAVGY